MTVFVCFESAGCGFDSHGEVFAHDSDLVACVAKVFGDAKDSGVVVSESESFRKYVAVYVVEFDLKGPTFVVYGDGLVKSAVLDSEFVEKPEGFSGEVAKFSVVTFGFQLGDDHQWHDYAVFCEFRQCVGVGQQHGCVNHEGALPGFWSWSFSHCGSSLCPCRWGKGVLSVNRGRGSRLTLLLGTTLRNVAGRWCKRCEKGTWPTFWPPDGAAAVLSAGNVGQLAYGFWADPMSGQSSYVDFIVVLHNGLLLVSVDGVDSQDRSLPPWRPSAHGPVGGQVAAELGCPVEASESIELDGQILPVVTVAPRALPNTISGYQWLTPEEAVGVRWPEPMTPWVPSVVGRMLDGAPLPGAMNRVVRIGGTVRRPQGAWSPGVHAGLRHLEEWGLDCVPRVVTTDALNREVLTYLPGRTIDGDRDALNNVQIAEVTSWLLRLHEALRGFQHDGPFRLPAPEGATIFGHNDFGVHNLCFAGNRLIGVIDWDTFGPTTVPLELAWLAWTAVPLWRPISAAASASRLNLIADTYDIEVEAVLEAVPVRVQSLIDSIKGHEQSGDPGFAALFERGDHLVQAKCLELFLERLPEIQSCL